MRPRESGVSREAKLIFPARSLSPLCSYALIATSTDYDAFREEAEPVTVEEVLKTLKTNADLSKHITASILGAVHDAVQQGLGSSAAGGMKFSLMTPHSEVSPDELWRLKYLLPQYFPDAVDPAKARSKSRPRTEDTDDVQSTYGVPVERGRR